ncbi:hypothetical protein VRU48_09605 [Pedobacter sp. KR3-3]|uniref:DUF4251 domain-containing protein n=1 Tax=Pedobacter albus TaxID=3113905 RepID=A0ABU7I7K6_9SPHI|nr:hypothetical protein [Pedobacter sp. KR3-3]MEE1945364.1 hypothetical protein [Pedobacter sp. KR3-3]
MKAIPFLAALIAIVLCSACSFQKNLTNPNPLTSGNLTTLNGKYDIVSLENVSSPKPHRLGENFLQEIDRKLLKDTLAFDSTKKYGFELQVLTGKRLKINYLEDGKVARERILKTKLKSDGYLYLKNKNVGFVIVPYVFGALDVKKTRLTKTATGDLVFDVTNHVSGAIMLIGFLDGRTWKYRNVYPKTGI